MLQNRLRILMAERNLKVRNVHELTGLSRSALTLIRDNKSKTIKFDTLNILLELFDATPNEFFNYNAMHEPLDAFKKWEEI